MNIDENTTFIHLAPDWAKATNIFLTFMRTCQHRWSWNSPKCQHFSWPVVQLGVVLLFLGLHSKLQDHCPNPTPSIWFVANMWPPNLGGPTEMCGLSGGRHCCCPWHDLQISRTWIFSISYANHHTYYGCYQINYRSHCRYLGKDLQPPRRPSRCSIALWVRYLYWKANSTFTWPETLLSVSHTSVQNPFPRSRKTERKWRQVCSCTMMHCHFKSLASLFFLKKRANSLNQNTFLTSYPEWFLTYIMWKVWTAVSPDRKRLNE